jgi:2-hydroxychromene-2-carboxylate isomerase
MPHYDIEFFWDPVCPFAWITSRWITKVSAQTGYKVDWRLISLRLLNKEKEYATAFPPNYERGHTAGLRMLRVAAKIRAELGRVHMGALYEGYGRAYWDQPKGSGMSQKLGTVAHIGDVLHTLGLPVDFATAADDERWDAELDAETQLALSRTGRDVGTPIITFAPPDGVSLFGPVISRIPRDEEAVPLWNAVLMLATFPGFAELKRSLREAPQVRILGHLPEPPLHEEGQEGHRAEALPEPQA